MISVLNSEAIDFPAASQRCAERRSLRPGPRFPYSAFHLLPRRPRVNVGSFRSDSGGI